MASGSLEKKFAKAKHESMPGTNAQQQREHLKNAAAIQQEGEALSALNKRRQIVNPGRVRDLSIWGVTEDSIISQGCKIPSEPASAEVSEHDSPMLKSKHPLNY